MFRWIDKRDEEGEEEDEEREEGCYLIGRLWDQ